MSKLNDMTPEQWDLVAENMRKRKELQDRIEARDTSNRSQLRAKLRSTKMGSGADSNMNHTTGSKMDEEYYRQQRLNIGYKESSDGSSASYYELPSNASELQDLISDKNMNAQIGEIFRECYRYGRASHSDEMRGIKKILFYAKAELVRLQNLEK
jgi:hypothetical protein